MRASPFVLLAVLFLPIGAALVDPPALGDAPSEWTCDSTGIERRVCAGIESRMAVDCVEIDGTALVECAIVIGRVANAWSPRGESGAAIHGGSFRLSLCVGDACRHETLEAGGDECAWVAPLRCEASWELHLERYVVVAPGECATANLVGAAGIRASVPGADPAVLPESGVDHEHASVASSTACRDP